MSLDLTSKVSADLARTFKTLEDRKVETAQALEIIYSQLGIIRRNAEYSDSAIEYCRQLSAVLERQAQ